MIFNLYKIYVIVIYKDSGNQKKEKYLQSQVLVLGKISK